MIQAIHSTQRHWWARLWLGLGTGLVLAVAAAALPAGPVALAEEVPGSSKCGEVRTTLIKCDDIDKYSSVGENEGGYIFDIIGFVIRILTAGVGIVAVGGIVYGAILYASASDSQAQVNKALEIIRNVVIGLVAYALMYVLIEFLIPGGLFNK